MKIAVTDACIFIDLIDLQLTSQFFGLDLEVHTTLDVFNELNTDQKELLKAYSSVGKLTIHNLTSIDSSAIHACKFPRSLSYNDQTVLYLAEKLKALIISSDKAVRKQAKSKAVEYHGILWVFDLLIKNSLLSKPDGATKLKKLLDSNLFYKDNPELNEEIEKRIKDWSINRDL